MVEVSHRLRRESLITNPHVQLSRPCVFDHARARIQVTVDRMVFHCTIGLRIVQTHVIIMCYACNEIGMVAIMGVPMSEQWGLGSVIWAKTNMANPEDLRWENLPQHSLDTMILSSKVWDEFLPESVKRTITDSFGSAGVARRVIMFLAGCHDVGKATPAFERQAFGATGDVRLNVLEEHGLTIPRTVINSSELRHEISGYWTLTKWLEENGVPKCTASQLAIPVGGHHGVFHSQQVYGVVNMSEKRDCFQGETGLWEQSRISVVNEIARRTSLYDDLDALSGIRIPLPIQTLIAGIITVSDWMASDTGSEFYPRFPLLSNGFIHSDNAETERVDKAWKSFGFTKPHEWNKSNPLGDFSRRFGLPHGTANSMQRSVVNHAMSIHGPGGLLIIEAPMGSGKTEAALLASDIMGANSHSGGLAFALPTQATANGILPRIAAWTVNSDSSGSDSVSLLHGRAWLNDDYKAIKNGELYKKSSNHGLKPVQWFNRAKQGILANIAVCTIDQILMMALQSKHYDLKHLGLAGKVIIIDEVHAADDYMMVYLIRALEWLGAYHAPVILLSATLPFERRRKLALAYRRGLAGPQAFNRRKELRSIEQFDELKYDYPLITKVDSVSSKVYSVEDDAKASDKDYVFSHGGIDALRKHLVQGGNALIIRNSVGRAQSTFDEIRNDPFFHDWDVKLIHARFTSTDRKSKERELMESYGRRETIDGSSSYVRPERSILIATQVVEQSLDVDFDIMLTDVCPMDLLMQRLGRVHRHPVHDNGRPEPLTVPHVIIDGWSMNHKGISVDSSSKFIYGESKLLRTIALTGFGMDGLKCGIPSSIAPMVQSAYNEPETDEPYDEESIRSMIPDIPHDAVIPEWFPNMLMEADRKQYEEDRDSRVRANAFLLRTPFKMTVKDTVNHDTLIGSNCVGEINSDEKMMAQVRDSTMGINCIIMIKDGGYARFVDSVENGPLDRRHGMIPLESFDDDYGLIADVSSQFVGLPYNLSNPRRIDSMIDWLERNCLIQGWQGVSALKGEFVLLLDGNMKRTVELKNSHNGVDVYELSYSSETGLSCVKTR